MSRKIHKISNFHGGLDEVSSPVDLKSGFFTDLTDVMVDKLGQIVPMGDFDVAPTQNPTNTNFIVHAGNPGFGLFAFNSNRQLDGTFSDCVIYVVPKYISGDEGENFIFWDSVGNSWAAVGSGGDLSSHALDLRSEDLAGQFEHDYFAWGGVLRICDGNMANITTPGSTVFGHDSHRGWLGYVLREHFPNADPGASADLYAGWYGYTSVQPIAPTAGYASSLATGANTGGSLTTCTLNNIGAGLEDTISDDGSAGYMFAQDGSAVGALNPIEWTDANTFTRTTGTWNNMTAGSIAFKVFTPAGAGAVLDLTVANSGGFLLDANYTFGLTFVYDGHQESPIYDIPNGYGTSTSGAAAYAVTGGNGDEGTFTGTVNLLAPFLPRISGIRVYYQYDQDMDDKYYLAWDIDFTRGARVSLSDDTFKTDDDGAGTPFTRDTLQHATDEEAVTIILPALKLPGESFESINGYSPKEDIDIRYKTSTAVGNLVYVGNCYKKVDGIAQHFPDRIWRCALPTYTSTPAVDVFPETYWISNPGISDPIVKLVGFGTQLLAFGLDYLTVYTITAQGESITGTFPGYGIDKPCQATATPHGVAFTNQSGAFVYNGQTIINLLHKKGTA